MDWAFFAFQAPIWFSSLVVLFQQSSKVLDFIFKLSPGSYFYSWDNVSECFNVLEKNTPWPIVKMVSQEGESLFSRSVNSFFLYKKCLIRISPLVSKGEQISHTSQLNCLGFSAQSCLTELSFLLQGGLEEDKSSYQIQLLSPEGHAYRYEYVLNPGKHANPVIWEEIGELIETWLTQKELYRKLDMTWAMCILLHGPPGTGKTTLVKQLAAKFGIAILYATEFSAKPPEGLVNRSKPFMRVIEDADRRLATLRSDQLLSFLGLDHMENSKQDADETSKSSTNTSTEDKADKDKKAREGLGAWINTMDGPLTLEGQIIVLTVNDLDKIPNVIRDRCHEFEVTKINLAQLVEMTKSRFDLEVLPTPISLLLNSFLQKGHSLRTFKRILLHTHSISQFELKISLQLNKNPEDFSKIESALDSTE